MVGAFDALSGVGRSLGMLTAPPYGSGRRRPIASLGFLNKPNGLVDNRRPDECNGGVTEAAAGDVTIPPNAHLGSAGRDLHSCVNNSSLQLPQRGSNVAQRHLADLVPLSVALP